MRVFLSHSSADKGFVDRVAHNLRPGTFELDSITFDKGGLNAREISAALKRSDLFCLFLSNNSMESSYVDYESVFSQELVASGDIKRVLTICLDAEAFSKYQGFAKHYNMVRKPLSPESAARLIEGTSLSSRQEREEGLHPFVGREAELKSLEDQAVDMSKPLVKGLFVAGNSGSGRSTIAKKFYQNHYPHVRRIFPQIFIEDFQGFDDIFRNIITALRPSITLSELKDKVLDFAGETEENRAKLISEEINSIAENGEALIIHDNGGLLKDNGALLTEFNSIVNYLANRPHPPVVFISPRMTSKALRREENDLVYASVGPLSFDNCKRLLARLLKENSIIVSSSSLDALTDLADQHPFNIYRIVELVKDQSVDIFLANPIDFIDWKHKQTSEYLRTTSLTELDSLILAVFSIAPELDFQTLCDVIKKPSVEISKSIQKMMDLHVVRIEEDRISISPALRVATERDQRIELKDSVRSEVMISLANSLSARLEEENGPITLIDATILATLEGDGPVGKLMEAFILPSHRVWLAKRHYDAKRWSEAIKMSQEALEGKGRLSKSGAIAACRYLALSAARINDQDTFQFGLTYLKKIATDDWSRSNVHFLEGFNYRLSGDLINARLSLLESYNLSIGNRSTARELASVCLNLERPEEAEVYAREAYGYAKQNPFIIDILISCLIHTRKRSCRTDPEVMELLDALESIDREEGRSFYMTRKAEIEHLYGDNRAALQFIGDALAITPKLFEPLRLYSKILLKDGNPSRALEQINLIDRILRSDNKSGNRPHHRQFLSLKAEYYMEIGRYSDAQALISDGRYFSDDDRDSFRKSIEIAKSYRAK